MNTLEKMVEKKKVPSRLRLFMQNFLEVHELDWKLTRAGPFKKALEGTSMNLQTPEMGGVFNFIGTGAF